MSVRAEILQFLRAPQEFSRTLLPDDDKLWLQGLEAFAQPQIAEKGDFALREAQVAAWNGLANHRVGLIQGPPGTGKTYVLSWMALGYLQARRTAGLPCRILVNAFTLNAIGNLLDAIQTKAARYLPFPPDVVYLGNTPGSELNPAIQHIPFRGRDSFEQAWDVIENDHIIAGCSVWALNRFLNKGRDEVTDGPTSPLFHLVCIDEASQMVVSNGLMALAALAQGGRVLVAGDDKQLPPVRTAQEHEIDGRRLGGSLYDFLKSAQVMEFPLDETFRLNAPLTSFPETKFYPGRYRSTEASADRCLELRDDWDQDLESWERVALDPNYPLCVLLHDGPTAGTSNPFEVTVVSRLVRRLYDVMTTVSSGSANHFWQDRLAVVSPHRAQNAAIRAVLANDPAGAGAVVETVDKIQGKERDAIIASYTVSDPEFALAEAEFIFGVERLNVTITRARTKLILVVSRRLLDVVPPDETTLDAAQILRELVFDSAEVGTVHLTDNAGRKIPVNVRVRGFTDDGELPPLIETPEEPSTEPLPELTSELEEILTAIRDLAIKSPYGTAADFDIKKKLYRQTQVPLTQFRNLARLGHITLDQKTGKFGLFWIAKPLDPPRTPFSGDAQTVRERLEQVIAEARSGRYAPFYSTLRHRFVWMAPSGDDVVWPVIESMAREGQVKLAEFKGSPTVEWVELIPPEEAIEQSPKEHLSDQDFEVLNHLEDMEARRINFGITETWTSLPELATSLDASRGSVSDALRRLQSHGHLLMDEDGRIRSRMAELAREVRYVKQRFAVGDADRRPYLVRSLKVEVRDREKPERNQPLSIVIEGLREQFSDDPTAQQVLAGLGSMLRTHWEQEDPLLASFQARSLQRIFPAWLGTSDEDAFVITADTGSGKTEAACLPLIAAAAYDKFIGVHGTRAVLVYPRVRLAANQAQRITGYLATLAQGEAMPLLTLGIQNWQVPTSFEKIHESLQEIWRPIGKHTLTFPFFGCPDCGGDLHLHEGAGQHHADKLTCTQCPWTFEGWVGSKAGLRQNPPTFFLPVTESLHQWQQDPGYGVLFGDVPPYAPPRAILADEIHLYTHIHGAQVGYTLRRLLARAANNTPTASRPLAIGMSATLGDPARVWGELIGRNSVTELRPESGERLRNPRGREYFYFVQPEVESRGRDIASASTSIQSLMCLAHGMRRRTGLDGGYRAIVFLDSIDKLKRLHSDYQDAEEAKGLAALRTRLYDDDPGETQPRRECCGQPASCDRFRAGECWYFAATDQDQINARGRYRPGNTLAVADRPVFSGTGGNVDDLIHRSDVVFTTSSLEVGYDDPDITLVYQHYAPNNLASFIQRKGRGGRGVDDRPITGVTLSPYSPRDSWYYHRPHQMLDSTHFAVPLNVGNYFVRRGQVLAALLDAIAHRTSTTGEAGFTTHNGKLAISKSTLEQANHLIRSIFGADIYRELGYTNLNEFWRQAISLISNPQYAGMAARDFRNALPWIPQTLFATVNLPSLEMRFEGDRGKPKTQTEAINLAFESATPGNMTRRYGFSLLHWIPPKEGKAPWFSDDVYQISEGFTIRPLEQGAESFLRELPIETRNEVGQDIHPKICLPGAAALDVAGKMHGAGWVSLWFYDEKQNAVQLIGPTEPNDGLKVHSKSRGSLRGFTYVEIDPTVETPLPTNGIEHIADHLGAYLGGNREGTDTGLSLTSFTWGADAELRLKDPAHPDIPITQTFIHPRSGKTLLHGYRVETEGIRLRLNSGRLTEFLRSEMDRLRDHPDGRWHRGQMFRYLIGSQARATGINAYEANRTADLLFSAAAKPGLRETLNRVVRRWDSQTLRDLLQQTYAEMLACHPLLSERRVDRLADALGDRKFQRVFVDSLESIRSDEQFAAYLRSILIHSIAIRLKQAFVLYGLGDERQVLFHAKLPIQFGSDAEDVIIVAENGAHGDGTTRMFAESLQRMLNDWSSGTLGECPNAREDALMEEAFRRTDRHAEWRSMDPRNLRQMAELAAALGVNPGAEEAPIQSVMRLFYGAESVGHERIDFYYLHSEIRTIEARLLDGMERQPSQWELVSTTVHSAANNDHATPHLTVLLNAYQGLEDAYLEESLDAKARLADQVYRISSRLCVDGCQGCLHTGSDLMSDALSESVVSRRLLQRLTSNP